MAKTGKNDRLEQARMLVQQLEAGNEAEADRILDQIAGRDDSELFQELGRLTRELHEAINGFLLDDRITELAHREIPDASERLSYVITMTEKSANIPLNSVESGIPLTDELSQKAAALAEEWGRFRGRKLSVENFRALSKDLTTFLDLVSDHSRQLHGKLNEVLLAQDFQDLTGQIIRQVIKLVHDVEEKLVQLIRISGAHIPEQQAKQEHHGLEGPVVPGIDQGDVLQGQDDVDDLLSSLGF